MNEAKSNSAGLSPDGELSSIKAHTCWFDCQECDNYYYIACDDKKREVDLLKRSILSKQSDSCPVHKCIYWLAENKSCTTNYPSDILSEHFLKNPSILSEIKKTRTNKLKISFSFKVFFHRLKTNFLEKFIHRKHYKQYLFKKFQKHQKTKRENLMKNLDNKISKKRFWCKKAFILKLNFNTNRPCINTNRNQNETPLPFESLKGKLTRTYSQDYESFVTQSADSSSFGNSQKSESTTKSYDNEDNALLKEISRSSMLRKHSSDQLLVSDSETESEVIENQIVEIESNSTFDEMLYDAHLQYGPIDKIIKRLVRQCKKQQFIPENYCCHFRLFVYIYPSNIDDVMLTFRRHELKRLTECLDYFDIKLLLTEMHSDFLFDRRLKMVETQSNCKIFIEKLAFNYINGLPHRILNIHSQCNNDIVKALTILEQIMPEVMETAVYNDILPETYSQKFPFDKFLLRNFRKITHVSSGFGNWKNQIDKARIFPIKTLIGTFSEDNSEKSNLDTEKGVQLSPQNLKFPLKNFLSEEQKSISFGTDKRDVSIPTSNGLDTPEFALNTATNTNMFDVSVICELKSTENHLQPNFKQSKSQRLELTDIIDKLYNSCILPNYPHNLFKNCKRIKCSGDLLKQETLHRHPERVAQIFSDHFCQLYQIKICDDSGGDFVKLTIFYRLLDDFDSLCYKLGLSKPHKSLR